ncbi:MAG: hypothetical protein WBA23_18630 [Tunicatimonas sp.]|uniref:hypothetical protein n=1 Tax=Tunicatimonas sp. TaxID=1940096 RepID=UPI003C74B847
MSQQTPSKKILNWIWTGIFSVFYPIIMVFSLLFVGVVWVFSTLSWMLTSLVRKIFPNVGKEVAPRPTASRWQSFFKSDNLRIERLLKEEIMFGPAYYKLRAIPDNAEALAKDFFGDFKYPCFDGVLLQKFNTVIPKELPDFDLVFLNLKTGQLKYVETIKSFSWNVEESGRGIVVSWQDGEEQHELRLTQERLLHA